jgi:two-component system response regulator YesN
MYRLLIVDDEEIIVNGLYEIFKCMKNLDIDVYKAYSGKEAIEWLNRTRIDIVLTDIRMPEIDGLQLLDEIYKSWPQCRVIFLTGYNEFEYVYKAIQHSGVTYILKTEDNDKVINAVENAIKEIQNGIKIEGLILKAKEQINMAVEMFQNDYFIHLLHGEISMSTTKSQFEQLAIPMRHDLSVLLLLGHVDNIPPDLCYSDKIQYLYSIRLIISQNLNTKITSVNVMDEKCRFVLFIQPKALINETCIEAETDVYYKKAISFLKGTLEVIQTACRESLDASVSFVLSGEPCTWENISKKYYSLNQMFNYKIDTDIEILLIDNELENNVLTASPVYETVELGADTETLEMQLRKTNLDSIEQYLEAGQSEKFFEILSELMNPLKSIRSRNNNLAIEAYYKIALTLLSYINRWKLTGKIAFYIGQNKLMHIEQHQSWADAVQYMFDISNIIFKLQSEERKKRADNAIDYIQKYIEDHLSEDLSLVRLAEKVYLNPSYLSRLYKQTTGTTLSDFIDNARIKKAKEMLKKENVKIHEVSKAVGYETAASFTRFFRKIKGCSPQEYHDTSILGK